jgi:hypothetical protein
MEIDEKKKYLIAKGKTLKEHLEVINHKEAIDYVEDRNEYMSALEIDCWNYEPSKETLYNPTASFIGFILKFADRNSKIFELGCILAKETYSYFKMNFPIESMHTVYCFVELYEYM